MNQAAAQAQYLLMASAMNADFTHALLTRNFLPGCGPPILPGLAHLVAPALAPPPSQPISQGPLPALTDSPGSPATALATAEVLIPDSDHIPSEDVILPERAKAVPPS